jgi:hypothetical protein
MVHKFQHIGETLFIFLAIHWQPIFGIISACCAAWYYLAMIRMNIVDKFYDGSWYNYLNHILKQFFKPKKKKQ